MDDVSLYYVQKFLYELNRSPELQERYLADRQAVLDRMVAAMDRALEEAWAARSDRAMVQTPEEALILASIIEKETARADERGLVASVYSNRLRQGMRLQADPTLVYFLSQGTGRLGRGLRRSELDDASNPYNTYQRDGLPPGPIANPGRESIGAARTARFVHEFGLPPLRSPRQTRGP